MKVLHVFKTYYPDSQGGTEQFIHQLISEGRFYDVEADVFTLSSDCESPINIHGIKVFRAKKSGVIWGMPWSLSALFLLRRLSKNYDLIHFHHPWPFIDLIYLFALRSKPAITTYHLDLVRSRWIVWLYQPILSLFFRYLKTVVVTSEAYLNTSPHLKAFRHKARVIPIGINEATYPIVEKRISDDWTTKITEPFVVFVGTFRYYKGLDDLIIAAQNIQCQLILIGDGPLRQQMEELVMTLNLQSRVIFLGAVDDPTKLAIMSLARALILPSNSRAEAFGVVLLEAMMLYKPMITTEIGTGTSWVNKHEVTGLVVPKSSPEALSNSINWMIDNPIEALRMGKNARNRYERLFQAKNMAMSYLKVYEEVLSIK